MTDTSAIDGLPLINGDSRDLEALARSLYLGPNGEIIIPGTGELALAAVSAMLSAIAVRHQQLDNRVLSAFRDGELQATLRRAERSNVISIEDVMTREVREAIDSGRVKVTRLNPAGKREATIDELNALMDEL